MLFIDQMFSFCGEAEGFNTICTDNFMKNIISVPIDQRLRKKLVYAIHNNMPEFEKVKNIGTTQIPFVTTNSPLLAKEISLLLRYKIDGYLTRKNLNKTGNKRMHFAYAINEKYEYENPQAEININQ
jgi:hypothetical protein